MNLDCQFRTITLTKPSIQTCPLCQDQIIVKTILQDQEEITHHDQKVRNPLTIVLDNIRSVLNVGSIFRTSDAIGVKKIYLCGITPTPDHPKLAKSSLGAEWSIPWEYSPNAFLTISKLKLSGMKINCLEENPSSRSVLEMDFSSTKDNQVLVVGNELAGIDPEILQIADRTLFIPMFGYKRSLNVAVAFGIAAYQFVTKYR
jgi:23S rRNA (guanosine2251-2'-O)-methyltransferase